MNLFWLAAIDGGHCRQARPSSSSAPQLIPSPCRHRFPRRCEPPSCFTPPPSRYPLPPFPLFFYPLSFFLSLSLATVSPFLSPSYLSLCPISLCVPLSLSLRVPLYFFSPSHFRSSVSHQNFLFLSPWNFVVSLFWKCWAAHEGMRLWIRVSCLFFWSRLCDFHSYGLSPNHNKSW